MMLSPEEYEKLVRLSDWLREQDLELMLLLNSDELVAQFLDEVE